MSKNTEKFKPTIVFKIESFIPFTNSELKNIESFDEYDNINKVDDYTIELTKILHGPRYEAYEEAIDAVDRHKEMLNGYLSTFARAKRVLEISKYKVFLT